MKFWPLSKTYFARISNTYKINNKIRTQKGRHYIKNSKAIPLLAKVLAQKFPSNGHNGPQIVEEP